MSKKTCFMIFVISFVVIMASFVAKFTPVTREVTNVFEAMQGLYLSISAAVISFFLKKQKHYWLIMLGCAVVCACLIELLVVKGSIISIAVLYKILAFIVYAYFMLLMKFMV